MAQLVKCSTLGLGSGCDCEVMRSSPPPAQHGVRLKLCLPLSLPRLPTPVHVRVLALSKINKSKREKKGFPLDLWIRILSIFFLPKGHAFPYYIRPFIICEAVRLPSLSPKSGSMDRCILLPSYNFNPFSWSLTNSY